MMLLNRDAVQAGEQKSIADAGIIRIRNRLYQINIVSVEWSELAIQRTWLVTLKRVSDTNLHLSIALKNANITRREAEVINWLNQGLLPLHVAEKLSISYHTAKTHIRNIYKKLNISSARELEAFIKHLEK
jgi:DNA-binding CsgD family transcriptional regulator